MDEESVEKKILGMKNELEKFGDLGEWFKLIWYNIDQSNIIK